VTADRMTVEEYKALPKANKFGARATVVDGITFHSKKEADRYKELKLLEHAGVITGLELQVPFEININGIHITTYKADFVYYENGRKIVEDSKGMRERLFKMKKKMVKAAYDIDILET
jgi:hypothetical protein